MAIYLYIETKNFNSFKKFSKIFFRLFFKNNIRKVKYYPLVKKRTLFSLLKSPHVNKTAQEQYAFKKSHRKLFIQTRYCSKSIYLLKKIYYTLFASELKIKILYSNLYNKKSTLLLTKGYKYSDKLIKLDLIGERKIKNLKFLCLNSSVG